MIKENLEKAESLATFHMEEGPWTYDKTTGDIYDYDEFEEAFIPLLIEEDATSGSYRLWSEITGKLTNNGKTLKIKVVGKSKNGSLPEGILYEELISYDIESRKSKSKITQDGEVTNWDLACVDIPVEGIDVKLKSES